MTTVVNRRGSARRGQALVELAVILPLLLGFAGIIVDFGRAYAAQVSLESATRAAAEYVAGYSTSQEAALSQARTMICGELEGVIGYVPGDTPDTCLQPDVAIASYTRSSTAPGATAFFPLGSVTVEATVPFEMLMHWPWLDEGTWTLRASESFQVLQGR
jgi:Flp pilus assembly protein TadG